MEKIVSRILSFRPKPMVIEQPKIQVAQPTTRLQKQIQDHEAEPLECNDLTEYQTTTLTNISMSLKQQTEKIGKWKVSTEIALQQKDQQLSDLMQTSENQRKTILELQLENEQVSNKLQDEMKYREDAFEKLSTFRALNEALKTHTEILMLRMEKSTKVESHLNEASSTYRKEIDTLTKNFNDLESLFRDSHSEMKKQLGIKLAELKEKLLMFEAEKQSYEKTITELNVYSEEMKDELEQMKLNLNSVEASLSEKSEEYTALKGELLSMQVSLHEASVSAEKFKCTIEEIEREKCHVTASLNHEIEVLKQDVEKWNQKFDDEKGQNLLLEKELQHKDEIISATETVKEEMEHLITVLQTRIEDEKLNFENVCDKKDLVEAKLLAVKAKGEEQLKHLENEVNNKVSELQTSCEKNGELVGKLTALQNSISELENLKGKLEHEILTLKDEKQQLYEEKKFHQNENQSLKMAKELQDFRFKTTIAELDSSLIQQKVELTKKDEEINRQQKEINNKDKLLLAKIDEIKRLKKTEPIAQNMDNDATDLPLQQNRIKNSDGSQSSHKTDIAPGRNLPPLRNVRITKKVNPQRPSSQKNDFPEIKQPVLSVMPLKASTPKRKVTFSPVSSESDVPVFTLDDQFDMLLPSPVILPTGNKKKRYTPRGVSTQQDKTYKPNVKKAGKCYERANRFFNRPSNTQPLRDGYIVKKSLLDDEDVFKFDDG